MTETLAHGYSSESTLQELSNKYQHNRVELVFKYLCVLVLWTKVSSALEGLSNRTGFCLSVCPAASARQEGGGGGGMYSCGIQCLSIGNFMISDSSLDIGSRGCVHSCADCNPIQLPIKN